MTVRILIGDVRDKLRELPDASVDCVVTSPPYWGLRDYGVDGQIGLERTLGEHLDVMVAVGRELRRVMKPHASAWINYGDTYATKPNGRPAADIVGDDRTFRDKPFSTAGAIYTPGYEKTARSGATENFGNLGAQHGGRVVGVGPVLKPKDLCLVPNRLAIAFQEDGWWVRSEIIWAKPNPMPDSSGRFRPSTAHEKIWLLGTNDEPVCWRHADGRWTWQRPEPDFIWRHRQTREVSLVLQEGEEWTRINLWEGRDMYYEPADVAQPVSGGTNARVARVKPGHGSMRANGGSRPDRPMQAVRNRALGNDRGKRDHFSPDGPCDDDRETRYLRNYEPAPMQVWEIGSRAFRDAHFATFPPELAERCILAGCPVGGTVLDPFGGAGTTGLVADRLQRHAVLIELNPEYAAMAQRRIESDAGRLFDTVSVEAARV